jgi:hypothetical protein
MLFILSPPAESIPAAHHKDDSMPPLQKVQPVKRATYFPSLLFLAALAKIPAEVFIKLF